MLPKVGISRETKIFQGFLHLKKVGKHISVQSETRKNNCLQFKFFAPSYLHLITKKETDHHTKLHMWVCSMSECNIYLSCRHTQTRGRTQTLNSSHDSLRNYAKEVPHIKLVICTLFVFCVTMVCTRVTQICLSARTPTILTTVFPFLVLLREC